MKKYLLILLILFFIIVVKIKFFDQRVKDLRGEDLIVAAQQEGKAYTYGMPDDWGNYKGLFEYLKKQYGISRYDINMSSGDNVKRVISEKDNPQSDSGIIGITYGHKISSADVLDCYVADEINEIPKWAIDPEHPDCPQWYATLYGIISFMINKEVIKNPPHSWNDLLKPEYKNKIGYMNPTSSATGLATVLAATYSHGGSITNLQPGIEFFKKLHQMGNIKMTGHSGFIDFAHGVTPILIGYDFSAYQQKKDLGVDTEIIFPKDGTLRFSYIYIIVKNPPHPYAQRFLLNFFLSKKGQQILAEGAVHPVREDVEFPEDIKKFYPKETPHFFDVDWTQAGIAQSKVNEIWGNIAGEKK